MKCTNCGEDVEKAAFCSKCGNSLSQETGEKKQQSDKITIRDHNKKSLKRGLIVAGIVYLLYFIFQFLLGLREDIEYTNNEGDKLPVVVTSVAIGESDWNGYLDITVEIENVSTSDYRETSFILVAWDSEGYPLKVAGMYDAFSEYINYVSFENVGEQRSIEKTFTIEYADIGYMSIFLSDYVDFDNEEWENPMLDYVKENQGKKLEDVEIYCYVFE